MFYSSTFKLFLNSEQAYLFIDFLKHFDLYVGIVSGYKQNIAFSDRYSSKIDTCNIHGALCFAYTCICSVQFWSEIQLFHLQTALKPIF